MKDHFLSFVLLTALCLSVTPRSLAYNDNRGHNLDSLERAVAPWTPDLIDEASTEQLAQLNRAYRDLMLGYNVLNGEKSMFYARKALLISEPRRWEEANADAYRYLGQHFWAREQYDSSMVYFNKALESVERMAGGAVSPTRPEGYSEVDIDDTRSALYGAIGNLYNMMDSIPKAMSYYDKAGVIFDKYGWNESNSILHYNIGETWLDQGDNKKASKAYDKALSYAQASGDSLMLVNVYKGFGRLYTESGRPWKALYYLREAESYYSRHPDDSPGFRTENLEYMESVLSRQKTQLAWAIIGLSLIVLLAAAALVSGQLLRRARKEKAETAEVMDEALSEIRRSAESSNLSLTGSENTPSLSNREKEILDFLSKGYTTPQIAEAVHLSSETIRWYSKKLIAKFDVSNTPELVSRAKEAGLI